jgi:hypothetical protein
MDPAPPSTSIRQTVRRGSARDSAALRQIVPPSHLLQASEKSVYFAKPAAELAFAIITHLGIRSYTEAPRAVRSEAENQRHLAGDGLSIQPRRFELPELS